jgi:hypothetical protein
MEHAMNAVGSEIGKSQLDESQVRSEYRPGSEFNPGRDSGDVLTTLGRVLRGHTWHNSQEWARALDELSRLSDDELKRVIDAPPESSPT